MILPLYSYNVNIYLFSMFDVTEYFNVRYVVIFLFWSMILVRTVLVRCYSCAVCSHSYLMKYCGLVDLRLFLVWCMCNLAVAIDGGRCL